MENIVMELKRIRKEANGAYLKDINLNLHKGQT